MDNKTYLDTLRICESIDILSAEDYELLSKSKFDLNGTVRFIQRILDKNKKGFNEYNVIINNIISVIKNKRDNALDMKEYIEDYRRFIKTYVKYYLNEDRDIHYLNELNNNIGPLSGIKSWKIMLADNLVDPEDYKNNLKLTNLELVNTDNMFIRNGSVEYIRVSNLDDKVKMLKRVLTQDDFDIVVITDSDFRNEKIYSRYLELYSDTSCGEYLDLMALLNNWKCKVNTSTIKDYDTIKASKFAAIDILQFLNKLNMVIAFDDFSIIYNLSILRQIVDKDDTTKKGIEQLEKLLKIRYDYLWCESIDMFRMMELYTFKEILEYVSNCLVSDVEDIEYEKNLAIYEDTHKGAEYVIVGEDGSLNDIESNKFGVRVRIGLVEDEWGS